ncbi:MAG: Rieske (2Fe-2S) protein [Alphaproteobacteria bacterium]
MSDPEAPIEDRGRATVLCALDDIADPGGRAFCVGDRAPMFVIRKGNTVHGYENCCPHQGTTLDWKPHTFLTVEKTEIICANHGALFRIESGKCFAGPCPGAALTPVGVRIEDGQIMLEA